MNLASVDSIIERFDNALLAPTPTKRVLFFGERCRPATATQARLPIIAGIGMSLAATEPEGAFDLVKKEVSLGVDAGEVHGRFLQLAQQELDSEPDVTERLRFWLIAGIGDVRRVVKAWEPSRASSAAGRSVLLVGLAAGAQHAFQRALSAWLYGINDEWGRAIEDGLMLREDPPFLTDSEFRDACCSVLTPLMLGSPPSAFNLEDAEAWDGLVQLWRFECFRIGLMGGTGRVWRRHDPFNDRSRPLH